MNTHLDPIALLQQQLARLPLVAILRGLTPSEAPTIGAKSILLITKRSERVMPGPPLRGIFSPPATSIT